MSQSHSSQKPTSPKTHSATLISSDEAVGEGSWMKGERLNHEHGSSGKHTLTSPHAAVACNIARNDDVSIIPSIDCYPNDTDKAREAAASTGVPGIQVYPVSSFLHASDSQGFDAVDASQNNDEFDAKEKTQNSPETSEIERHTSVRTTPLVVVSDSKAVTNSMEFRHTTEDVPAIYGFRDWKQGDSLESDMEGRKSPSSDGLSRAEAKEQQAHTVNTGKKQEDLGSGDITQCFDLSNLPVEWGTGDVGGIDIDSLLGDVDEGKANKSEDVLEKNHLSAAKSGLPSHTENADIGFLLDDGATNMSEDDQQRIRKCWAEGKSSSSDTPLGSVSRFDDRHRAQETELEGGSRVQHPIGMTRKTITVTTSTEQVVTANTEEVENSRGNLIPEQNSVQCSDTSKFPVKMLDTSHDFTASFGLENMTEDDRLQWGKGEGINVNDLLSYFEESVSNKGTEETVSGSKASNNGIDKLPIHERCTSSSIFGDQIKDVGGMDVNDGLQPWTKNSSGVAGGPPVKDTTYSDEEHLNKSSGPISGLRPTTPRSEGVNLLRPVSLSVVGHPVATGDYAPPDAKPDIQVGSVAVAEKNRNKLMDNAEKRNTGADFSLNDGTREITKEDRTALSLDDGWPGKLSDANTGLPPMTEEFWRELETEQTIRVFASDGSSEIDTGRVTAEASTDVPGIRIHPVDAFSDSSQILNEVDASQTITVTTSIEQVITLSTGAAENSKLQTEIKAIPPSNAANTNTVSCLTPTSTTSGDNRATSIPSKTQIGLAQLRPLPMNADGPEKIELPEPYPAFNSDRDNLPQDNTTPIVCGSEAIPDSGNIGQLSIHELDTSLRDFFHQTKNYGGTDVNHCLPPMSNFVSEHGTEETAARNNTQPETGGSKLCTPSSATTDIQVELAVETAESRDDSEANEAPEMCGNDVDFDLNCGARGITKDDYVRLGLHKLSWAKQSDTTTGPSENLRGLENAHKDSPSLVGDAINEHDSDNNVSENKTRIDIGCSKLPVNVHSLRNMKDPPSLIDFFCFRDPQESPGDAPPGSSSKRQAPKADDEPQTVDSAKTLDVATSDRADESGWVKVDMDTDNLPTQTDTVDGKLHRQGYSA